MKENIEKKIISSYNLELPDSNMLAEAKINLSFSSSEQEKRAVGSTLLKRGFVSTLLTLCSLFSFVFGGTLILHSSRESSIEQVVLFIGIAFLFIGFLFATCLGVILSRRRK